MPAIDVQQWARAYSLERDATLREQMRLIFSLTKGLAETLAQLLQELPRGPGRVRFEVRLQLVTDEENK